MMTKNGKLVVGVIGLGNMGRNHVRVAKNHPRIAQAVVFDMNASQMEQVTTQYECEAAASYEELLARVDVVIIASSTLSHFTLGKMALDAGRHCLIEKPITASVEEARILIEAAKEKNLKLSVGHVERYNPVFPELKKILKNEKVLSVAAQRLSYNLSRANDVSVVLDLMIHDIDTIGQLSDSPLTVSGVIGGAYLSKEADYVSAQLKNEHNVAFSLISSKISQTRVRTINISCEDCFVEADYLKKEIQIFRNASGKYLDRSQEIGYRQEAFVERVMVPNVEPLMAEQNDFYRSVLEGMMPIVTGEDGLYALRLAEDVENMINM